MIVEFAGLPRSGKTTCIDAAKHYFSRSGIPVRLAGEAARFCPFDSQHRIEMACWTANCALNAVLVASLTSDPGTLTLQDRGLFDALAFLRLLWREGFIPKTDLLMLERYFTDRRWADRVDLVLLFDAEPDVVLGRDTAAHVARTLDGRRLPGIITNESTLQTLRSCYRDIRLGFGDRFKIRQVPASCPSPADTARLVIEVIREELAVGPL